MNKSRSRRIIEQAIEATTDPQKKAELAVRLAAVAERESRTRSRQQRMKARAKKQAPDTPASPVDDGNELFEIDYPPAEAPLTQPAPAPELRQKPVEPEAPTVAASPVRILPQNGAGWSRTVTSWESPVWWSPRDGCFLGAGETGAVRARCPEQPTYQSSLEQEFASTGRLTWAGGKFADPQGDKDAEDKAFREYSDRGVRELI